MQIIVIGNEKGGSGKTTLSIHLIISLLKQGFSVGSIDLDSRQQSLTRYIENRKHTASHRNYDLLIPEHYVIAHSGGEQQSNNEEVFLNILEKTANKDFVVIDTPGSDVIISRFAHSHASTVVTPINDSFVDIDLIGQIDGETLDSIKPGIYSAMLWEQKMKRATLKQKEINWVVVRNRLSSLDAINKRNIGSALSKLSKRFGFTVAPGFGDRVIFKELFLHGLTLHDAQVASEIRMSTSVIAARQELRDFIKALNIVGDEPSTSQINSVDTSLKKCIIGA